MYNRLWIGVGVRGDNDKHERENSKVTVIGTTPMVYIANRLELRMQMGRMNELCVCMCVWGEGVTRYA